MHQHPTTHADMTAADAWRRLCRVARPHVSPALYRACFTGTTGINLEGDHLVVCVPNTTVLEQMNRRFRPLLDALTQRAFQRMVTIQFVTGIPATPALVSATEQPLQLAPPTGAILRPQFTFDTFIVGDSNRFAFAAAQSVANAPGEFYNPLFLYGGVGLGKTHLLMAIGHIVQAAGLRACYVTAETFTNEIIDAIQSYTQESFRSRYRAVDVLLVDDIQFIGGKERTEEEFFHTFNALHTANKQIVVTSDRPPRNIPTLHDRLRSRFEWGLLADVSPPDYEHRRAIVRSKAASCPLPIPDFAIDYLAKPEGTSVRALEGALNHLVAGARLNDGQITMAQVVATLRDCFGEGGHLDISPSVVIDLIAQHFDVPADELLGKNRSRTLAWPRQVAMYLLREETMLSLSQIGAALGGRDHTTIMYGCEHVAEQVRHDEPIHREIDGLRVMLRNM
jgi:chromosomal replication initiator protein